jgi:hypothetical protein
MKKGYTLVEVLTVLAIFMAISIPLSRLSKLVIYDIPKSCRLIESNTSILDILKYMKKDINSAIGFPQSFGQYATNDKCLLIEQQNEIVCYLAEQGKISRIEVKKGERKIVWQIPDGKIEWQVWRKNGAGYAVEIKKYVAFGRDNHTDKSMANAYVFFAGVYQEAVN